MVVFVVQSGLVFGQVHQGLGKSIEDISPDDLVALQKSEYISDIFYLLNIWFTKLSIVYLFVRLSPDRSHKRAAWASLGVATLLTLASIFVICFRCNLVEPWISINTKCTGLLARWQASAALDIISEAALFAVAVYMVEGLKTSVSKRAFVSLAFGLRLLVVIPILLRVQYLANMISSPDPTLDSVMPTICTQIHISYAIIATTIPYLRTFMSALSTNYGGPKEAKTPTGSKLSKPTGGSGSNSNPSRRHEPDSDTTHNGCSYFLDEITVVIDVEKQAKEQTPTGRRWDPERSAYRAAVASTGGGDSESTQSHESQRMIISKNTEWQVEYEGNSGVEGEGGRF